MIQGLHKNKPHLGVAFPLLREKSTQRGSPSLLLSAIGPAMALLDLMPSAGKDQISVKNTFIQFIEASSAEVDAVQPSRCRSSSLPAAFRTDVPYEFPDAEKGDFFVNSFTRTSCRSHASTESGESDSQTGSVQSEDATPASGGSVCPNMATDSAASPTMATVVPYAMDSAQLDPMAGFVMMPVAMVPMAVCPNGTGEKAKLSSDAKCFVPTTGKVEASPGAAKLSSGAKVFVPAASTAEVSPGAAKFSSGAKVFVPAQGKAEEHSVFSPQAEQLVEVVRVALMQAGAALLVGDVEATPGAQGWTVSAQILPEGWGWRERLLSVAKEALLRSAEQSESVYVLGYAAKPFTSTPLGFAATLAGIEDESKTCWWHVAKLSCRKGEKCTWQHPKFMVQIWVNITA